MEASSNVFFSLGYSKLQAMLSLIVYFTLLGWRIVDVDIFIGILVAFDQRLFGDQIVKNVMIFLFWLAESEVRMDVCFKAI